jgi:hypothetical protein
VLNRPVKRSPDYLHIQLAVQFPFDEQIRPIHPTVSGANRFVHTLVPDTIQAILCIQSATKFRFYPNKKKRKKRKKKEEKEKEKEKDKRKINE